MEIATATFSSRTSHLKALPRWSMRWTPSKLQLLLQMPDFVNGGMKIATDMNGDIQQPDEPLEGAAEVVDEMNPML